MLLAHCDAGGVDIRLRQKATRFIPSEGLSG